jgi:hypothetical protein
MEVGGCAQRCLIPDMLAHDHPPPYGQTISARGLRLMSRQQTSKHFPARAPRPCLQPCSTIFNPPQHPWMLAGMMHMLMDTPAACLGVGAALTCLWGCKHVQHAVCTPTHPGGEGLAGNHPATRHSCSLPASPDCNQLNNQMSLWTTTHPSGCKSRTQGCLMVEPATGVQALPCRSPPPWAPNTLTHTSNPPQTPRGTGWAAY